MKRLLMVLALTGAFIGGCGDDDDDDDVPGDGGRSDGGTTDAGGIDSGRPDSGTPPDASTSVMCGTMTCTPHMALTQMLTAGCATVGGAQVCGLTSASLGTDAGLPAFLQKNAPGVASPSCAAFFDSREPADAGTSGNGRINTTVAGFPVSYPGCCTAAGFCSGQTNEGLINLGTETALNGGFGCMESRYFFRASPPQVQMIACNPTTGVLTVGDAGVPSDAGTVADAGGMDSGT